MMGTFRTPAKRKGLKNIDANATMTTTELSYDDEDDDDGTGGGGGPLSPPSSKKKRDSAESAARYSASTAAWGSPRREYARSANVRSLILIAAVQCDPLFALSSFGPFRGPHYCVQI
jgi:hypothetical protein